MSSPPAADAPAAPELAEKPTTAEPAPVPDAPAATDATAPVPAAPSPAELPPDAPAPSEPPKRSSSVDGPALLKGVTPASIAGAAGAAVAASATGADAFLCHLNRCLQTPAGIDAVLATGSYGARSLAAILGTAAGRALLHEPAYRVVALLASRPSFLEVLLLRPTPALTARAGKAALVLAQRLRALGGLCTEMRTMMRLWALLPLYLWAKSMVASLVAARRARKAGEKAAGSAPATADRVEAVLGWTQLISCISYQFTENWAFLAGKGVLGTPPAKQGRLYTISSRSFFVYVVAELLRGVLHAVHPLPTDTPAQKKAAREQQRTLARYVAFAPMSTHWSMEKGFMSEASVALCGMIPAGLQMHKIWNEA